MAQYTVTSEVLELEKGKRFTVLSGAEVSPGQLALIEVYGYLILGRLFDNFIVQPSRWIELPKVRIELGENLDWRIVGPVVPVTEENVYACRN